MINILNEHLLTINGGSISDSCSSFISKLSLLMTSTLDPQSSFVTKFKISGYEINEMFCNLTSDVIRIKMKTILLLKRLVILLNEVDFYLCTDGCW